MSVLGAAPGFWARYSPAKSSIILDVVNFASHQIK
jgi:hypothetical protein